MDYALRMYDHVDLVGVKAEQPSCFYHLESLIHQRCRVDRDLRAHVPVWMLQRLLFANGREERPVLSAEWSARGCEVNLLDVIIYFADEALEDGGMFRIDREYVDVIFFRKFGDQFARYDERFLVR